MNGYDESTYGERIADLYDDLYRQADPTPAVDRLAGLAGTGPVLELGIGTGRLALPLAERGFEVHGIDSSPGMVAKMREKPGGDSVPVAMGNFLHVEAPGSSYSLVFVAINTFFALASQEEQVQCFRNVAGRLATGGVFVLETFVPDVARFVRGQNAETTRVEPDLVMLEVSRHDPINQRIDSQRVLIRHDETRLYPVRARYAWPGELDLMAQLAGMRLRHRWAGWDQSPFTATSANHVSVYEKPRGNSGVGGAG